MNTPGVAGLQGKASSHPSVSRTWGTSGRQDRDNGSFNCRDTSTMVASSTLFWVVDPFVFSVRVQRSSRRARKPTYWSNVPSSLLWSLIALSGSIVARGICCIGACDQGCNITLRGVNIATKTCRSSHSRILEPRFELLNTFRGPDCRSCL